MYIVRSLILLSFVFMLAACASFDVTKSVIQDASFDDVTADEMLRFDSEREFRRYLKKVKRKAKKRGVWWASTPYVQAAQACVPEECEDEILVTASKRSSSSSSSITNTQNEGVDEGDIVKQFKQYLIVLQDGRLFSVDTGKSSADLAMVDRINVYRDDSLDAWYDELLIFDDLLLVTGYSYEAEATELAVFKISENGQFSHQGTFYKSSDDYYDTDNYATRLVEDKLVIYTPIFLNEIDIDEPFRWPVIRKWVDVGDKGEPYSKGRNLFGARNIYYPIQRTAAPVLHSVSICPLGDAALNAELSCQTTAVIGPERSEYYVSKNAAFIWVSPGWDDIEHDGDLPECAIDSPSDFDASMPAALFSFPLSGRSPKAMFVQGVPVDQFSLESSETDFKALLQWPSVVCEDEGDRAFLKYFTAKLSRFSDRPLKTSDSHYTTVAAIDGRGAENRFTDHYVVYGGRQSRYDYAQQENAASKQRTVVAVPTSNPTQFTEMPIAHEIIRAERAGDNIVLTGHAKDAGLYISMVDLNVVPKISDTLLIDGRYESEGRSHAFNSDIKEDGSGIMGLPTTIRVKDSGRSWWRSTSSDVSFMTVNSSGIIQDIGPIKGDDDSVDPSYECEMSCVDWYGNTRPIFIDRRVFALIGTELVEGSVSEGKVYELGRVNISEPLRRRH